MQLPRWLRYPPIRDPLVAVIPGGLGWWLDRAGGAPPWVAMGLMILGTLLAARHWLKEGLEELVEEREVSIEILMLAAIVGSMFIGLFEEALTLSILYGFAEGVEEYAFENTRRAIRKLLDMLPRTVRVVRDGAEVEIPVDRLQVGDRIRLRPGDRLPVDGVVEEGKTSVDESAITGESMPVPKKEGDEVYAGSLNREGTVVVRATTPPHDNTLTRIVHLVEEAQETQTRAQTFVARFGRIYSPVVLLAAGALAFWGMGVQGGEDALYRAVVFLGAASPCALVISIPISVASAIARAGRRGILIKGGVYLEEMARSRVVAFDKTGTLTRGEVVLRDIWAREGRPEDVLVLAASVEQHSEHPLARAVEGRAREEGLALLPVEAFQAVFGKGVEGRVEGRAVLVGSPGLLRDRGVMLPDEARKVMETWMEAGYTVSFVAVEGKVVGGLAFEDALREDAHRTVQRLKSMGFRVVMLTGDHARVARAVARRLGVDEVLAELKPEDKLRAVDELRKRYAHVVMVGDGINDAPALARACVGVAMGDRGIAAVLETADVVLVGGRLHKLVEALERARASQTIARQNVVFSLPVLAFLIPGALLGMLSAIQAVLAHEVSELLATFNGLRA